MKGNTLAKDKQLRPPPSLTKINTLKKSFFFLLTSKGIDILMEKIDFLKAGGSAPKKID